MKLGLSTYTYTWAIGVAGLAQEWQPERPLTALGLLRRAAGLGVGVVQMADNLALDGLAPAELDAFEACAQELGIQVEVGTRGIEPGQLRRCLGLAERFGSPILRVVLDAPGQQPSPQEAVEILKPLQAEFEQAGVILAIENHDRFPAGVLAGIVRSLGVGWAGICLDTVNSFGALEGPQAVIETLGPLVVNLHVKDFSIFRATHKMGFTLEGRPAGEGRLDVPALLDRLGRLRSAGRDFNAILELWTPPEADLEATVAKEAGWAEQSVAYLRGLVKE